MRFVQIAVVVFILFSSFGAFAQEITNDSTATNEKIYSDKSTEEAELIEMYAKRYNPRIAGLFSAVLPGLGQAYNKKYLKIPLIYGGFLGVYYFVDGYNTRYQDGRKGLLYALANDGFNNIEASVEINGQLFTEENLRTRVNKYRRERDYWIIIGSVWYLLNIADAHIDAHLKEFELNEKLQLSVEPTISQSFNSVQGGLSLTLHFH